MPKVEISALKVYPIKSCRPLNPTSCKVAKRGLEHDRRWMVVDMDDTFMTRREIPEMAKIGFTLEGDRVVLSKDGLPNLAAHRNPEGASARVRVWRSITTGKYVSSEVDRWLTKALGRDCRLVYMPEAARRKINPLFNTGKDLVGFADGYPILIASEESLEDLNGRLDSKLTIDRFRPNIVIRGCAPFAEDTWKRIRIGDVVLRATRPCIRCLVTTQDPQSGSPLGPEPLKTLATYRKVEGGVIFGMYYVPEQLGTISIGDPVDIEA